MEFYFIDKSKFTTTNFSFSYFDELVKSFDFKREKNKSFHNYFKWDSIEHWSFRYDKYSEEFVCEMFAKSMLIVQEISFFVRLKDYLPLIKISYSQLSKMLFELLHETGGMGWEAISEDGKYILEFTDSYQHLLKSNFKILD